MWKSEINGIEMQDCSTPVQVSSICSQLALKISLVLAHQNGRVGIRIYSQRVQRIQLRRPLEEILVHLAVISAQATVQLPIRKAPRVDQLYGVRSDLLQQFHDSFRSGKLDLLDREGARKEEFRAFLLHGMQSIQTEKFAQKHRCLLAKLGDSARGVNRVVEIFHNKIL